MAPFKALAVMAPVMMLSGKASAFSGRAFFYNVEIGASECGSSYLNTDSVVALPPARYASGVHCGDTICVTSGSTTINVTVADLCVACPGDSIDLSPGAYQQFAPLETGFVNVVWD